VPQQTRTERKLELIQLLDAQDRESTAAFLNRIKVRQMLGLFDRMDDATFTQVLTVVGHQHLADLLAELEPEDAARHLDRLNIAQAADLTERMDPDDAADVIFEMKPASARQILAEMEQEDAAEVQALLTYPAETAGGLMTTEFVAVGADWTIKDTIQYLRTQAHEAETIYYVYVTNAQKELQGVISLRELIVASDYDRISDILNQKVLYVTVDDDQEDVAKLMSDEDLLALPVVDFNHRLIGIVTVDDVLDVLVDEYGEDLLKFSSIEGGDERPLSSAAYSIRRRLPWLAINIGLSLIGVVVASLFTATLDQVVVLALFIPVISNMGGNVGIQAVSVAIRGISTGEVSFLDFWQVLRKEMLVGFVNGLVLGTLLGIVSFFWQKNPALGLVTMFGLWVNVLVASISGGTLPFVLHRFGLDPAMMTGPLLTTLVDVVSILTYLGLATLFLAYLV